MFSRLSLCLCGVRVITKANKSKSFRGARRAGAAAGGRTSCSSWTMSEAEAEAPARLLRPVPPMGLAKDASEQELAVCLREALLRRFNEYDDLGSRLHAGTDEWAGDWLPQAGGARESICVGDNVGGDRLCWTRVDKDGVKEFVVSLRLGGEGELVLQVFSVCTPGHFEETHGRREGWEDADRVYGLAIGWANA